MHGAPPATGARGTQSSWRRQRVRSSCRRRELAARVVELAGARAAAPCGARVAGSCFPKAVSPPPCDQGRSPLRLGVGAPGGAGRCSPWPERTGVHATASIRSSSAATFARSSPVVKTSLLAVKCESSPAARSAAPPRPGGGASGGGHGGQQARFRGCCKCMLYVLGMFLKNVAMFHANVGKVDLEVAIL
jgi:hypothetical protein